jgi:hypothetical protein
MQLMQERELIIGLPTFEDHLPICHACQYGKQNRRPFPKSSWRATYKLQLIHTNVLGPQRIESLAGSRYYIAFIDNFSRMCWIFFLEIQVRNSWSFLEVQENGRKSKWLQNSRCKVR